MLQTSDVAQSARIDGGDEKCLKGGLLFPVKCPDCLGVLDSQEQHWPITICALTTNYNVKLLIAFVIDT